MPIATIDDIVAGLASPQRQPFLKNITAAKAAGAFQSAWLATGRPGAGAAPPLYNAGSGYTASSATAGAIPYTNAAVQNWLARMGAMSSQIGTLVVADRLWSCSGMGFAAATYTVTTPGALPARITDSGVGCEIWCEQFVAAGAASGTLTVNYLDQGGAAGAGVISAVVSAPVIGQMQPVPLATGDTGVSGIVSAVNSATWTSGTFGITILKRILELPLGQIGVMTDRDWAACLRQIPDNACLMLLFMANVTTAPTVIGTIDIIDK